MSYDNVVYGFLGGGYKFSRDTSFGASYDWATAAINGATRPEVLSIYGSHYITINYKLNGVLCSGLSDSSPDVVGDLTLNYYFKSSFVFLLDILITLKITAIVMPH